MEAGLRDSSLAPELESCVLLPLADGGDGTLAVCMAALGGSLIRVGVHGPRMAPTQAELGLIPDAPQGPTAVIELARASGIELLPHGERNPLLTTTYGTGELIRAAYAHGARHILIGIGGSATVDGGSGALAALGIGLLDANGEQIPAGNVALSRLARVTRPAQPSFPDAQITVLCDVDNPLLGESGAARVFGPQKGAAPADVPILEANLAHFAAILARDFGVEVAGLPHSGAAGGIGAGLYAAFPDQVRLVPGGAALIDWLGYREHLEKADLILTGEGKLDAQTSGGKAVQQVAAVAKAKGIPVIALAGGLDASPADLNAMGIRAAFSLVPGPATLDQAIQHAESWLRAAACHVGNVLALRPH